jgi:hypothetical protein
MTTQWRRLLSSPALIDSLPSYGFSGAGFLGSYHVGVAACLHKQGLLPDPNDDSSPRPLVTGVSAGSMIAAATLAGVNPEDDGMEVVLEATRRTRNLVKSSSGVALDFNISLDVLTPGFSLIDQVEEPFREAMVKALGGTISSLHYDIDPELFKRRFPAHILRIGLTDRRALWPPPIPSPIATERILKAYRYVDSYRDVDDIIACCMLSSYIPGATGPLNLKEKVPDFLRGLIDSTLMNGESSGAGKERINDTIDRSGLRLNELEHLGMVKHGLTGLPVGNNNAKIDLTTHEGEHNFQPNKSVFFWDGGIADVFPTFDDNTTIISPVNGTFTNPAICPLIPSDELEFDIINAASEEGGGNVIKTQQQSVGKLLRSYIPTTFQHCSKAQLGLNSKNARAALLMMFSSEDEVLYTKFREGYDDAKRFLVQCGKLRVFSG